MAHGPLSWDQSVATFFGKNSSLLTFPYYTQQPRQVSTSVPTPCDIVPGSRMSAGPAGARRRCGRWLRRPGAVPVDRLSQDGVYGNFGIGLDRFGTHSSAVYRPMRAV